MTGVGLLSLWSTSGDTFVKYILEYIHIIILTRFQHWNLHFCYTTHGEHFWVTCCQNIILSLHPQKDTQSWNVFLVGCMLHLNTHLAFLNTMNKKQNLAPNKMNGHTCKTSPGITNQHLFCIFIFADFSVSQRFFNMFKPYCNFIIL